MGNEKYEYNILDITSSEPSFIEYKKYGGLDVGEYKRFTLLDKNKKEERKTSKPEKKEYKYLQYIYKYYENYYKAIENMIQVHNDDKKFNRYKNESIKLIRSIPFIINYDSDIGKEGATEGILRARLVLGYTYGDILHQRKLLGDRRAIFISNEILLDNKDPKYNYELLDILKNSNSTGIKKTLDYFKEFYDYLSEKERKIVLLHIKKFNEKIHKKIIINDLPKKLTGKEKMFFLLDLISLHKNGGLLENEKTRDDTYTLYVKDTYKSFLELREERWGSVDKVKANLRNARLSGKQPLLWTKIGLQRALYTLLRKKGFLSSEDEKVQLLILGKEISTKKKYTSHPNKDNMDIQDIKIPKRVYGQRVF